MLLARAHACSPLPHVRSAFDVARQHVTDSSERAQRGIERIDRSARQTERVIHAFLRQHVYRGFSGSHLRHVSLQNLRCFHFE